MYSQDVEQQSHCFVLCTGRHNTIKTAILLSATDNQFYMNASKTWRNETS